jgi:hypothetical protein
MPVYVIWKYCMCIVVLRRFHVVDWSSIFENVPSESRNLTRCFNREGREWDDVKGTKEKTKAGEDENIK